MKTKQKTYLRALGMGTVAGMRSMTAPALLSHFLVKSPAGELNFSPLHYLQLPKVAQGLKLAAGAELAGDKIPGVPDRTILPVISTRILSGALVGATLAMANKQNTLTGAFIGGAAAAASSYLFCYLRKKLVSTTGLPDFPFALVEDALAIGGGYQIAKG